MNKRYITIFFGIVISLVMAVADTGKLYTSDKLSSSLLTSVCQDSYGYIWVGSEYGLNKFDGYSFTLYHTTQGDTTSIVNNNISTLYPSSNGFLWVGMSKGLCRYDYHNNNFVRYVFPEGLRPRVNAIAERNGDLLIGTAGYGLFSIRKGTKKIIREKVFRQGNREDYCSRLFCDAKGRLWRSSHNAEVGCYVIGNDYKPKTIRYFQMKYGPVVNFIPLDAKGFLAVCMYGIVRYDYAKENFEPSAIDMSILNNKVSVRTAVIDQKGNILFGTSGNGLLIVRKGSDILEAIQSPDDDAILTTANVNDIVEDKTGNLWVSCYNCGLYKSSDVNKIGSKLGEVFLTGMTIAGVTADCLASEWTIPYGESTFKMEFSLLDYCNTENITFEYRLNGGKWLTVPDGTNVIYFNRMMPGKYKLEVKATSSGTESPVKTYTLYVEGPWYSSPFAYFVYFLIVVIALLLWIMYYRRRKHAELDEAKMQFLINATHDIRYVTNGIWKR